MKLSIPAGTTSKRIGIFIQDSSSTVGAGLAALAFNTANLVCYSWIDTDGNANGTSQALQTATRGTWTTRGFVEKDATNMPGMYEFGIPDALLAAGVKWALIMFKGAANMAPLAIEIEVTAVSNQDAVRGGMTALPNANAEAAGGLYTRGSGAGQINQPANGSVDSNAKTWNGLTTVALPLVPTTAGRTLDVSAGGEAGLDWANIGGPTTVVNLSGTTIKTVTDVAALIGSPAGASLSADVAAIRVDTNTTIPGLIAALNNLSAAQVKTQMTDALNVDTYAQPGQATPAATTTIRLMLAYLYKAWRNKTTQTATEYDLYNDDAATVDQKATFGDDGTTATRGEVATGP